MKVWIGQKYFAVVFIWRGSVQKKYVYFLKVSENLGVVVGNTGIKNKQQLALNIKRQCWNCSGMWAITEL